MKKSITLLIALAIFMIPSVAFADTTEVAMVVEPSLETTAMDKITEELLQAKNETMEKEFKENHPELYEAFKKTIDTPYGFNMNMNVIANMDYPDEEMATAVDLRRVFGNLYLNGYINLPEEAMEMKMNFSYDAGQYGQDAYEGFELILVENMMYIFNPLYEMWETETLEDSDVFEATGNPMDQNTLAYMAPIADLMDNRQTTDSSIYSIKLTGDDIKTIVDDYVGMPIYDELITELATSGLEFEIPKIEIIYVLKDGVIRQQHTEIDLTVITEDVTVTLKFAMDGEYYSYGLQKEIETPELAETPEL